MQYFFCSPSLHSNLYATHVLNTQEAAGTKEHQIFLVENFCLCVATNFCCFLLFTNKEKEKLRLGPSVPQQVLIRAQKASPGNAPSQIGSTQPALMLHAGLSHTITP